MNNKQKCSSTCSGKREEGKNWKMVKKEEKDERAAHTFREVTWGRACGSAHWGGITGNYADFALFYFLPRSCSLVFFLVFYIFISYS